MGAQRKHAAEEQDFHAALTPRAADYLSDERRYWRERFHKKMRDDIGITDSEIIREVITELLSLEEPLESRSDLTGADYKELVKCLDAWYIVEGYRS